MKILIIDDEEGIRQTLQGHFELDGLETVAMDNAVDALERHRKELFPVVLTDIQMPRMSGVEFIREVKRIHPTCQVYVMTGYASLSNMAECLGAGATDYFMKPFESIKQVVTEVRSGVTRYDRWMKDLKVSWKKK